MTTDTTISISLIIAIISAFCTVFVTLKAVKKDSNTGVEEQAKISVKLDTICNAITDIQSDIRNINAKLAEMTKELISQSFEIKSIWKWIDDHSQQIDANRKEIEIAKNRILRLEKKERK